MTKTDISNTNKFKWIFYVLSLLIVFLLGTQTCKNKEIKYISKIEMSHDTIWPDTVKVEVPKPYKVHDTSYVIAPYEIPLDSIKMNAFFKTRYYQRSYRNKDIEITAYDSVVGYLIGQRIDYRLFKPLSIVNNTIVSVVPQDTIKVPKKWELRAGIEATPKNIYLGLDYQKDRISYSLAGDPFNKIPGTNIPQIKVGLKYTLFKK